MRKARDGKVVVKADGLALGKGVVVCRDLETANAAIADAMEARKFGAAGARVVLEEVLYGEELSFFALCNGDDAIPLGLCQDHKPIFDGDQGPNTGGMGAYTPVPQFPASLEERLLNEVVRPVLRVMKARGTPFRGVLFVGLMVDGERINVIEFNVRFGDPECEPLMMRFDGDLAETLLACAEGDLTKAASRAFTEERGHRNSRVRWLSRRLSQRNSDFRPRKDRRQRAFGSQGQMGDGKNSGQGFPRRHRDA